MSKARADHSPVIAIVQARMGSTRLPGKVLAHLAGRPMLERVVERARRASTLDEVVVATTVLAEDEPIAVFCAEQGYPCFRGHPSDVLDRYAQAAQARRGRTIVRLTADCPFIDPQVMDRTVTAYLQADPPVDYASNRLTRTFPIGLDVEVMSIGALTRAWKEADQPYQREHVTPYFYEVPDRFGIASVESGGDFGSYRWTVDTAEDLEFARQIYSRFGGRDDFGWREVLAVLQAEPQLLTLNAHVRQKDFREVG